MKRKTLVITGPKGSGKTFLAKRIQHVFNCSLADGLAKDTQHIVRMRNANLKADDRPLIIITNLPVQQSDLGEGFEVYCISKQP